MKIKFILSALLVFLQLTSLKAQIQFSKEYGGAYNEDGRWMEQLPDSGYIMVGGTNTYSNGQMDFWLVRADAYGNQLWTKSIGGTGYDFANMVKRTPSDNGLIIAGFTNSYGNGGNDGWIVKTDANGNTLWNTTVGDIGTQEFEGIVLTSDGGYAAVGINYSSPATQYYDIFLVKFNSAGVVQWQKNIGGQSYEIGDAIQETADHGFIISGQTYSYGNLDGDYYLVKTDSVGTVQWQKTYPQPGIQEAHYVQITPDGGYVMIGDADSLATGLGDTDAWMVKTDSNGDTLWTKTYGGNKKDGGKTVENTSDGGFLIAGITRSFGLINPNYYLVKTDSSGTIDWSNSTYGGIYHDHAYRGIETSDGGFAEFGYFRNAGGFMNYSLVKLGPNGGITKDISIDEFIRPLPKICRSNNIDFKLKLTNFGATNESNIIVSIDINNGSTITTLKDTLVGTLLPGTSAILSFDPTYNFNVDGTYTLTAYTAHRNSDISYSNDTNIISLVVLPPTSDPTTTSATNCIASSLSLNSTAAASADSMFWFDASVNGSMVSSGSSYITPTLASTTTYYVESVKGTGSKVGPIDNTIGSGNTSNNGFLKFDTRLDLKLISVKVYANSTGNRTIELRNSAGVVLQSKTVNLPVGESRVYLNFDVPQGNDFQLGLGSGSGNLFRSIGGTAFPYSISKTIEIYGTSSSSSSNYYYFYDWYIFVPSENCNSNRVPAQAFIGSGPTTAFDKSRCGTGNVTLTANSGASLSWFSNANGGPALATGSSFTTPSINSTTTYYLQVGSCTPRIAVQAIVNTQSTPPTTSNVSNCGPGVITLSATSSDPLNWYDAATNGTLVASGSTFTTQFLNSTATYYVSAGNDCPSARVAAQAIINASASPIANDVAACGPVSVTLNATSADPVGWYDQQTGGTLLATTYNFTTPVLINPVTYYAQSMGACPSSRIPVVADITTVDAPVGTDASHCGTGSVVISSQSINTVSWWSVATGGTQLSNGVIFTTPSISSTTTYYAQATDNGCNSTRTPVTASIINNSAPSSSSVANCGPGTITLNAIATDTIYWFDMATGGNPIATGSTFTTPSLTATTTYYLQTTLACPSPRSSVDAIISSIATDPVTSDTTVCGPVSITISASASNPISWYDAPGGTLLGTGNSFTTPTLSASTTYYAVAGTTGCISNAVPLNINVNRRPADPTTTGASNCGPASLSVSAAAVNPISWYSQPSGGTLLATGNSYTANYTTSTTIYVEAFDGNCSSNRIPTTINIYTPPAINIGPAIININSGQTVTLDAGAGYTSYAWSNGTTTQTMTTGMGGFYYVTVTDNHTCVGSDSITINVLIQVTDQKTDKSLMIYPNPSTGVFNVTVNDANAKFELKVTDALGRIIVTDKHIENVIYNRTFDLSTEASGVYFITLTSPAGVVTRNIIIE